MQENYIEKYDISDIDLWTLKHIENLKLESSYMQKQKLKKKSLGVLKKYHVTFLDLGLLINQIRDLDIDISNKNIPNLDSITNESGHDYFTVYYIICGAIIAASLYVIFTT